MRIDLVIVSILMFSIFILVGFNLFGATISNYEIENANSSKFAGVNDELNQLRPEHQVIKGKITGKEVRDENVETSMFSGGFEALRSSYTTLSILGNVTQTVVKETSIGDSGGSNLVGKIFETFMVILGILLAFTILAYIFRFMPR